MTRKVLSLLIVIIFAISLTACTPQVIVNTNDTSQPQPTASTENQVSDSAQADNTATDTVKQQSSENSVANEPSESSDNTSRTEKPAEENQEESKTAVTENVESATDEKTVNSEQTESKGSTPSDATAETDTSQKTENSTTKKETSSADSEQSKSTASEKNESQKAEKEASGLNSKQVESAEAEKTESQETGSGIAQDITPKTYTGKITVAQAKEIAFEHAKVKAADVYDLETQFDRDDGVESYEIEFKSAKVEYEYDIHAETGEILKAEKDDKDNGKNTQSQDPTASATTRKTADEAKAIAFAHAGVSADKVYDLELELDRDDGTESYEIEFKSEKVEYKYDIHAETGEILNSEKEIDD